MVECFITPYIVFFAPSYGRFDLYILTKIHIYFTTRTQYIYLYNLANMHAKSK